MGILESDNEIMQSLDRQVRELRAEIDRTQESEALSFLARELESVRSLTSSNAAHRTDDCFHCRKPFSVDEPSWYWCGSCFIHMHIRCLLDWLPRLERDIQAIKAMLSGEAK